MNPSGAPWIMWGGSARAAWDKLITGSAARSQHGMCGGVGSARAKLKEKKKKTCSYAPGSGSESCVIEVVFIIIIIMRASK